MLQLSVFILLLIGFGPTTTHEAAACKIATADALTIRGHRLSAINIKQTRKIAGEVREQSGGNVVGNALIEVFPDPKIGHTTLASRILLAVRHGDSNDDRVAACWTQGDGKFSFDNIAPGKYLILVSKQEHALAFGVLTVSPKASAKQFKVWLLRDM